MRVLGVVAATLAPENADNELPAHREDEGVGGDCDRDDEPLGERSVVEDFVLEQARVEGLFCQEAEERWQTGHGKGAQATQNEGDGHGLAQSAELADIARVRRMLHDARHEKQCRLIRGVIENLQGILIGRLQSVKHGHQTERGKRRAGQDRLQVGFLQCLIGGQGKRDQTESRQDGRPGRDGGEDRQHAPHEKDARFDHGGGVEIGRYGSRRHHRVGQPEVKRPLGAFGEGPGQDED